MCMCLSVCCQFFALWLHVWCVLPLRCQVVFSVSVYTPSKTDQPPTRRTFYMYIHTHINRFLSDLLVSYWHWAGQFREPRQSRHKHRQQIERQTGSQTNRQADTYTDIRTGRPTYRQTDTDRQADSRQTQHRNTRTHSTPLIPATLLVCLHL